VSVSTSLLEPDLAHDAAVLIQWATETPEVTRVWLFGSRIRGTHRPASDLDVAVEYDGDHNDSGTRRENWREALKGQTRLTLRLETCEPGMDTRIQGALAACSLRIYQRRDLV
jgi:predicted nucleotidyltransferase